MDRPNILLTVAKSIWASCHAATCMRFTTPKSELDLWTPGTNMRFNIVRKWADSEDWRFSTGHFDLYFPVLFANKSRTVVQRFLQKEYCANHVSLPRLHTSFYSGLQASKDNILIAFNSQWWWMNVCVCDGQRSCESWSYCVVEFQEFLFVLHAWLSLEHEHSHARKEPRCDGQWRSCWVHSHITHTFTITDCRKQDVVLPRLLRTYEDAGQ